MQLVPSKGGEKTQYYSKVHAGNLSRKVCDESAAHKMYVDNKRKMDQRKEAKRRSLLEARKSTRMKPIVSFFPRQISDTETLPQPGAEKNAVLHVYTELY